MNSQSAARVSPTAFFRKVGPQSRTQASLLEISTTRTLGGSFARQFSYCAHDTPTVTSAKRATASATRMPSTAAETIPPA